MMSTAPLSILLIEDSHEDFILITALLKTVPNFSFNIAHVCDLKSALSLLKGKNFDAAIVDLNLPDATGIEAYEAIKAAAPEVAMVIVTGLDDNSMLVEAMKKGASNYLRKDSFDGNRIATAILAAIQTIRKQKSEDE